MPFLVARDGRWSGGGEAMLQNFASAAVLYPDVFTASPLAAVKIIPRNVPVDFPFTRRPFVIAPQNAWPWRIGSTTGVEAWRVIRLRAASELAIRQSSAVLRISSAIPSPAGRSCSPVLHNVLDVGFDAAVDEVSALERLDLQDTIVSIGSLFSYRNLGRLLAAHARYQARGGRLRLHIAGPAGANGVVSRIASTVGESPGVSLQVGSLSRVAALQLMRDAAGVVLPSAVEASPLTALEAAAMSDHVLLSDIVGHREILEGIGSANEDAFFDPYDVDGIAAGLHRLQEGLVLGVGNDLRAAQVRREHRLQWAGQLVSWLAECPVMSAPTGQ